MRHEYQSPHCSDSERAADDSTKTKLEGEETSDRPDEAAGAVPTEGPTGKQGESGLFVMRNESGIMEPTDSEQRVICDLPPGVNDLDPDWRIDALDKQIASNRKRVKVLLVAALASSLLLLWANL